MKKYLSIFFLIIGNLNYYNGFAINAKIKFDNINSSNGLSQSTVNCAIQDRFGFMWFGTQDGLNKYDGFNFKIYKSGYTDSLSIASSSVNTLLEDGNSNIWIGTNNGLSIYNREYNKFVSFKKDIYSQYTLSNNDIKYIFKDHNKDIWIATANGLNKAIYTYINGNIKVKFIRFYHILRNDLSIASNSINTIIEDTKQNLWIGLKNSAINRFNREKNEFYKYSINGNYNYTTNSFYINNYNDIWASTSLGLVKYDKKTKAFQLINLPELPATTNLLNTEISKIIGARKNEYWLATKSQGLFYYNTATNELQQYKESLNKNSSIASNNILDIYKDKSQIIWLCTNNGVSKFDPYKQFFQYYTSLSELSNASISENIWAIFKHNNNIYIGTDNGVYFYNSITKTGGPLAISFSKEKVNTVYSINLFDNNNLLIAGSFGLLTYNIGTKKTTNISLNLNNKKVENVFVYHAIKVDNNKIICTTKEGAFYIDLIDQKKSIEITDFIAKEGYFNRICEGFNKNEYWICSDKNGLYKLNLNQIKPKLVPVNFKVNDLDLLKKAPIMYVYQKSESILFIATFGNGLLKLDLKSNSLENFNEQNGLCNNVIYCIQADNKNKLWLTTNYGLSSFDLINNSFTNFYETDGLLSNEFNLGAWYSNTESNTFYIGGINGFLSFNPSNIKQNSYKPYVAITKILLNNKLLEVNEKGVLKKDITFTKSIEISYKENSIAIEYAALHFANSSKNEYAYMLDGIDETWNYAGNRRVAVYNKLAPGNYLFKLKSQNADGLWNNEYITLRIIVKPPFYKTWWFNLILFFTIATSVLFYYKNKARQDIKYKLHLEQEVKERTEEVVEKNKLLQVEKNKSEKLLLNILPEETVEELKIKGKASARQYRQVTVMFTDFVGFTKIAESYRPQELIAIFDRYFIKFDEIVAKYQIEKIKTIGDSYMCASGLPIRNKTNAIDMVLAALEIQDFAIEMENEFILNNKTPWNIRIGIHTGELIAGVIGIKRFAYDIWGDTVNTAQRMEECSDINKVNISEDTFNLIKEFYDCTYRGKISAKNKGDISMYFVNNIKNNLTINQNGKVPSIDFYDRIDHLLYSKVNYTKAEKYILKLLEEQLPTNLHYHKLQHTLDVCEAAERIAIAENITSEDLHLVKTAALMHDAGFIKQYEKNEPIACEMAFQILPQFGYSDKQISKICELIMATQIPTNPKNLFEQIVCDADLDYLGTDRFKEIGTNLFLELFERKKLQNHNDWYKLQIHFLQNHKYYTNYSLTYRNKKKKENLDLLIKTMEV